MPEENNRKRARYDESVAPYLEAQSRAEAALRDPDAILIPVPERQMQNQSLLYQTKQQYDQTHELPMSKDESDRIPILIKTHSGNFLTRTAYYHSLEDEIDPNLTTDQKVAAQDQLFKTRMEALGLSDKSFHEMNEGSVPEAQKYVELPGGRRERTFNFKYPEQAGQFSPDVLIRDNDGIIRGIWPKLEEAENLRVHVDQYGAKNVLIRSPQGVGYLDVPSYETTFGRDSASKEYLRVKTGLSSHERGETSSAAASRSAEGSGAGSNRAPHEMPHAIFRAGDRYFSREQYLREQNNPRPGTERLPPIETTQVLFKGDKAASFLPPHLKQLADKNRADSIEKADLPQNYQWPKGNRAPEVLVRTQEGVYVSSASLVNELEEGQTLAQKFGKDNIHIQNLGKQGLTGGFSRLDELLERKLSPADASKLQERLGDLNVMDQNEFIASRNAPTQNQRSGVQPRNQEEEFNRRVAEEVAKQLAAKLAELGLDRSSRGPASFRNPANSPDYGQPGPSDQRTPGADTSRDQTNSPPQDDFGNPANSRSQGNTQNPNLYDPRVRDDRNQYGRA